MFQIIATPLQNLIATPYKSESRIKKRSVRIRILHICILTCAYKLEIPTREQYATCRSVWNICKYSIFHWFYKQKRRASRRHISYANSWSVTILRRHVACAILSSFSDLFTKVFVTSLQECYLRCRNWFELTFSMVPGSPDALDLRLCSCISSENEQAHSSFNQNG